MAGMMAQPHFNNPGSYHVSTAFTPVPTRKALGSTESVFAKSRVSTSITTPTPTPAPRKIEWPQGVREYVQRCFALEHAITGIGQDDMQVKLKQIINEAAERDALGSVDWANFPLPQQILAKERADAAMHVPLMTPLRNSFADFTAHDKERAPANHIISKKRKSSEIATADGPGTDLSEEPPWRVKSQNVFESRITYPEKAPQKKADKRQRIALDTLNASKSEVDLERRKQRFDIGRPTYPSPPHVSSRDDTPTAEAPQGPIVGTCQELEKRYLRLTAPPKPESVRPLEVLRRTYDMLKKKWKKDYNYAYTCDQLKSLRQDLTVQHIKNSFTVDVYELHARIALEKGDLGEYNQCQTQLRALYKQRLGGHPAEFLAYRILYFIYTCNRTDMNDVLADLTPIDRQQPAVKHALSVRSALSSGNYHRFFQLFHDAPNMGGYLIDMFIARERVAALAAMCKAYKPEIPLPMLSEELSFEDDQDCAAFICDQKGEALLDAKPNGIMFAAGKAGQLFENAKAALFRRVDIKGQI